jgi:hypothetical protein
MPVSTWSCGTFHARRCYEFETNLSFSQGVFQMGSFQHFEQLLLQTTTDLLNRRAEIQGLKNSISAAEAFKRGQVDRGSSIGSAGRASPSPSTLTADRVPSIDDQAQPPSSAVVRFDGSN